jgi:hypothetical protein
MLGLFMLVQGDLHTGLPAWAHHPSANSITQIHRHMTTAYNSCRVIQGSKRDINEVTYIVSSNAPGIMYIC